MVTNNSSRTIWRVRPISIFRIVTSRVLTSIHITFPRPRTFFTAFLFFGGLSIPWLMMLGIVPISLLMGFIGFAMTVTGGVLALVFCGEVY